MDCIIAKKDGTIIRTVTNAVQRGNAIYGDNGKWAGKPELFDLIWTTQELTPVTDEKGLHQGYRETAKDIKAEQPGRGRIQQRITRQDKLAALADLDEYMENPRQGNVDEVIPHIIKLLKEVIQWQKTL